MATAAGVGVWEEGAVIQRIEYANEDHTRTAVIVRREGRWCVFLGDRARASARVLYAGTMTRVQAYARAWCQPEVSR